MSSPLVGVVAIQGDFELHRTACHRLGATTKEVRTPEDLDRCTHLILPGGESSTVGLLMQRFGLGPAIQEWVGNGGPIWGTCMGMILLAEEVEDVDQYRLGLLDVTVRRNAFGAQVHSFETPIPVRGLDEPVMGVFIRAPIVTRVGTGVEVLSEWENQIVAVRQGNRLGTSYHPELTDDTRLHAWFLSFQK